MRSVFQNNFRRNRVDKSADQPSSWSSGIVKSSFSVKAVSIVV